jgi:hypothetical protein
MLVPSFQADLGTRKATARNVYKQPAGSCEQVERVINLGLKGRNFFNLPLPALNPLCLTGLCGFLLWALDDPQ